MGGMEIRPPFGSLDKRYIGSTLIGEKTAAARAAPSCADSRSQPQTENRLFLL